MLLIGGNLGANEGKSTALLTKEGEQGDPCEHCEHLGGYLDVKAGFNLDHKKL